MFLGCFINKAIFLVLQFQIRNQNFQKERLRMQHSLESTVANFVQKSFEIISNRENSDVIEWLPSGRQFIIKDTQSFQSVVLPHYFRHRNINSFIRQLNMYGFHKSRKQPTKNIFSHPSFLMGKPELLINVRRKLKEDKSDENTPLHLTSKKNKQDSQLQKLNTPVHDPKSQTEKVITTALESNQSKLSITYSKQSFRSRQYIERNLQKRKSQLQRTAIKPQNLISFCSMDNMEEFGNFYNGKSVEWPFVSLIEKSAIMELNPQVYNLKAENITSLNQIDEIQFDFSSGKQKDTEQNGVEAIENERKRFNSRMANYNILQTVNFMSGLNL